MSKGKRYDEPQLNIKKVIATIVAIIVVIMVIISIKRLLSNSNTPITQEVTTTQTYFPAYMNEKWGVIDNTGELIINANYDEMVVVPDKDTDLFICTYGADYETEQYNTRVLDKTGAEILTDYQNVQAIENTDGTDIWYEKNCLIYKKDEKYGLIDFKGKTILNNEYDDIYSLEGVEKNLIIEKEGLKGLVNASMREIVITPEYTEISLLTDSYEDGYIVQQNGKYGIISANGKRIFEPTYDEIKKVASNGYYSVVQNGKTSLINNSGEVILSEGFDNIEEINGENLTITKNSKYGVIDVSGNSIINNEYDDIRYIYGTYYIAQKDGFYGIISTDGVIVVDFKYTTMDYVKTAGFVQADNENYKTDLINRDFEVVLSDVIISELNLEDGYLRVRDGDDYSYYNFNFEKKSNREILPSNTLFLVKEAGKYGYENKNGERIVDCIYDDAKEQNKYGYCAVKKDGVWGALKSDGTVIVQPLINLDEYLYVDFIGKWYLDKSIDLNIYTR